MPDHHQTLARLDHLVGEARELCARAQEMGSDAAEAAVHVAFQTVLGRRVQDWMDRTETTVRTVRPDGDTLCGQRASELRRLLDAANVALLKRSDGARSWSSFHQLVLSVPIRADIARR